MLKLTVIVQITSFHLHTHLFVTSPPLLAYTADAFLHMYILTN